MKNNIILLFILCSLGLLTACEKANINVDTSDADGSAIGEVSGVWSKGSVQHIKGDIVIPEGKTLTIEEGVTILMDSVSKPEIIVLGNLYALGTSDNPVRFTVEDVYKTKTNEFGKLWGGILAAPSCQELVLDNTVIEYGGAITSDASKSVKLGLYKKVSGEALPALWFSNPEGKLVVQNSSISHFHEDCTYIPIRAIGLRRLILSFIIIQYSTRDGVDQLLKEVQFGLKHLFVQKFTIISLPTRASV